MQTFKIQKRGRFVWNTVLFVLIALLFHHIIICLTKDTSALDSHNIVNYLSNYKFLIIFLLITLHSIFFLKKISSVLLPIYLVSIFLLSVELLFFRFDKVVLLMIFTYAIFSFYFVISWISETKEPYYSPLITKYDLTARTTYLVKVQLHIDSNKYFKGYLTNWNEYGCFVRFYNSEVLKKENIAGKTAKLFFEFEDRQFEQPVQVISIYPNLNGFGFKFIFNDAVSDYFSWADYYMILEDRGYIPEYVS